MILPDHEIVRAIAYEGLGVEPFDLRRLQPASLDLTLGEERIVLFPGDSVLAHTREVVTIPPLLAGRIEGKSSIARLHVWIHAAGFVDPGFHGDLTLELFNAGREMRQFFEGDPIAQIAFFRMSSAPHRPYGHPDLGSHYQGQRGATASWLEGLRGPTAKPPVGGSV